MTTTNPTPTEQETLEPPERIWLPADTDADTWNVLAKNPSRDWSTGKPANNIEYARVHAADAGPRGDAQSLMEQVEALTLDDNYSSHYLYGFELCRVQVLNVIKSNAATIASPTGAESDLISRKVAVEIADARLKDVPDTVDLEADRNSFAAGYVSAAGSIKAALLRTPSHD